MTDESLAELAELAERLVAVLRIYPSCAVAFSGGVDSAVVAQAAYLACGEQAVAVTAVSPSLASGELEVARRVARQIGIPHQTLATQEFLSADYQANRGDRCYHCKTELYRQLERFLSNRPETVVVNGSNADDWGDYRPGLRAAKEHRVRSPLAELRITKEQVRELARYWNLEVADKPASPCLASRIAYGETVSVARLRRIDAAEQLFKQRGFDIVRVRLVPGEIARVEVAPDRVPELTRLLESEPLAESLRELGFQSVEIEPEGFRSGRLNAALSPHEREQHQVRSIVPLNTAALHRSTDAAE